MPFRDLIGQSEAIHTVREAIDHQRLAHALLLTGPAGVGKLALAQAIAQYVNCLQPQNGDSCGRCANCLKIQKAIHPDLRFLLPIIAKTEGGKRYLTQDYFPAFREGFVQDPYYSFEDWQATLGGENKQLFISVHEVRDLKRSIYLKAFEAPYKVVIVWHAELIRVEGANAFLKLLEEPPDRTIILLTCSDPSRLLTTINSRCQRLNLRRLHQEEVSRYLQTRQGLPQAEADTLAAVSEGSIGRAKVLVGSEYQALGKVYVEWLRAVYLGDYQKIHDQMDRLMGESKELQKRFLDLAVQKMRDSFLYHMQTPQLALAVEEEKGFHDNFSRLVNADKVARMVDLMDQARIQLAGNVNTQMTLMALSLRMHAILRGELTLRRLGASESTTCERCLYATIGTCSVSLLFHDFFYLDVRCDTQPFLGP